MGTDKHGMGSTFGDHDGDGDLDWFVTAIELFDGPASDAKKPKAHVAPDYWDRARRVARERAVLAGLRTAVELRDAFR